MSKPTKPQRLNQQQSQSKAVKILRLFSPLILFAVYMICQLLAINYLWLAVILTLLMAIPIIRYQKVPPRDFKHPLVVKSLLIFGALWLIILTIATYSAWLQFKHIAFATPENQRVFNQQVKRNLPAASVLTLLMAPIFEEGIFRLCLISFKSRFWLVFSTICSMLLFAAMHIVGSISMLTLSLYLIPTLYLTLTYVITRDIRCSMILHLLYNAITLTSLL